LLLIVIEDAPPPTGEPFNSRLVPFDDSVTADPLPVLSMFTAPMFYP
jgi:hypothetical protein